MIDALSKSDGIQNVKITNLCGHLLFDSSEDPAWLAGVDDTDDKDTSLAGVPVCNTTVTINIDDDSGTESNHNSVDPNEAGDNSSKASVHSTRSHISVHSTTSEPPQHPLDEEELDDTELPDQVPILYHSKRVSVPPSNYIPWMGGKMYVINIQTNTNQDKEKGLVYNHDEASVLATVITTYNKHMECIVEEQGQQHVATYSLKTGINKFGK